ACAWRNLIRMVGPDLVIFDFSPTALLACRGLPVRRALIGSGFCCPPPAEGEEPWAVIRPIGAGAVGDARLRADEEGVLVLLNRVPSRWRQPPLRRLGDLYSEVDENFLTTF